MKKLGSTTRFIAHARAKVNLALEVLRKRPDGYHEIETILQSINLFDELDIEFTRDSRIKLSCSDPDIPTDRGNLCFQAVEKLRPLIGEDLGAIIHIDKRIPHSAGLGGGSSDAAAVLLAGGRAVVGGLTVEELTPAAAGLGSDVPFMLRGGTMLGQGRGERLTPLKHLQSGYFLIVKPPVAISTAETYKKLSFRLTKNRYRFNLKAVNTLLARFPDVALTFRNALEDAVCPAYPLVREVLEELLEAEPLFAAMSGSGSALFAICESEPKAFQLAERFSIRGFFTAVAGPSKQAVDLFPTEARCPGLSEGGA